MVCSITMDDHDSVTELRTTALSRKGPPPRAPETIAEARALRAEHAQAAAQGGATASTVTPLATRKSAQDIPTPGEAA